MPFVHYRSVRYFVFESLKREGLVHAIFTRRGGCSPEPWRSLNVGRLVGDQEDRIEENHQRAFLAVGRRQESIFDVRQIHSSNVFVINSHKSQLVFENPEADAILTDAPDKTLFMRFADCVPILFYDPDNRVAGIAHAGWRGTVKGVAPAVVKQMVANFNSVEERILVGIGPSICVDHYEVGSEVIKQVKRKFGTRTKDLLSLENGKVKFDLWSANKLLLSEMGVKNIEVAQICTACNMDDWYSHRGEKGKTGRFGALIGLVGEGK